MSMGYTLLGSEEGHVLIADSQAALADGDAQVVAVQVGNGDQADVSRGDHIHLCDKQVHIILHVGSSRIPLWVATCLDPSKP